MIWVLTAFRSMSTTTVLESWGVWDACFPVTSSAFSLRDSTSWDETAFWNDVESFLTKLPGTQTRDRFCSKWRSQMERGGVKIGAELGMGEGSERGARSHA